MFKIGEFSRLSQVPVKTLRYYDEIGLLRPAEVDDFTGYRHYSADQMPRLNRILALKDLGLSLAQIGELLDGDLPAEQIRGMLRMKQAEVKDRVKEEQARLDRVERRLNQIEQEGAMARPAGPGLAIYYDDEYRESDVDVEAAVPLSKDIPEGDRVKVRELAAVKEMASTVHKGNYDTMGQSYGRLLGWIEANGYRIVGPNREIYIECAGPEYEPAEYVTELQFPVQKV